MLLRGLRQAQTLPRAMHQPRPPAEQGNASDADPANPRHEILGEGADRGYIGMLDVDACLNEDGYGEFHRDGRAHGAHRVSYELSYGAIPTGMEIDHTCHNPPCVNPGHLRATTHAQNGQNRSPHYGGDPSKTRGVSWHKGHRAYQARVGLNGHQTHLGFFANREDALRVVAAYRREHMPYSVNDAKEDA